MRFFLDHQCLAILTFVGSRHACLKKRASSRTYVEGSQCRTAKANSIPVCRNTLAAKLHRLRQVFSLLKVSEKVGAERCEHTKSDEEHQFRFSDGLHYIVVFFVLITLGMGLSKSKEIQLAKKLRKEYEKSLEKNLQHVLPGEKRQRLPWPVVHRFITEIREGQRSLMSLYGLYEQVKVFYANDWLLMMEIGKILSIHTNHSLKVKGRIIDAPGFRDEVLKSLIRLRNDGSIVLQRIHGSSESLNVSSTESARVPREVQHLLDVIIEDLAKSTLSSTCGA